MALAKKAPVAPDEDMGALFGDISEGAPAAEEKPVPDEGEGDEELPPGFAEAGEEFLDASLPMEQRLLALKRAIHACTDSY